KTAHEFEMVTSDPGAWKSISDFKFSCPNCDQHLQCDEQFCGNSMPCLSCYVAHTARSWQNGAIKMESGKTWATFIPSRQAQHPKGVSLNRKQSPPPSK